MTMFKLVTISLLAFLFVPPSDSARILCVFPFPSVSHQAVFRALTNKLLDRGHQLTVITTSTEYAKEATPKNLTEIDMQEVALANSKGVIDGFIKTSLENPRKINMIDVGEKLHNIFMPQFKTEEFQKVLKKDFDLVILEAFMVSSSILMHLIKAPVILFSSFGSLFNYNAMGVPSNEFLYPSMFRRRITNLTYLEEIYDIYNFYNFEKQFVIEDIINNAFKNIVGETSPTLNDLNNNIDMFLLNQYPLWEGVRPTPKSVVHLGGIHTKPGKKLPQDLQKYFDASINGVIYVSFGTVVHSSSLPSDKLQVMVNVLSQVPYDVLWKYDGELPGNSRNIKTVKWLPQADLLRHPKIKLFITQGGLQSTDEAIDAGVPLIGIPFICDQFFNSENFVRFNIGLKLDVTAFTEVDMKEAVMTVISNNSYRENVIRLRTLLKDQPQTSLASAISWIEYVIRHQGAKQLRSPAANLPWTQYFEVELILIVMVVFVLSIFTVWIVCCAIYRRVRRFLTSDSRRIRGRNWQGLGHRMN